MSTRANIILKNEHDTLHFYRHSDGYPESTGQDLTEFVKFYTSKRLRLDVMQSAGWLVIRGHREYLDGAFTGDPTTDGFSGWKCGAYEPTTGLHADVAYVYVIDLFKRTLETRAVNWSYTEGPDLDLTKLLTTLEF
jgi:hypothetical protein